jgi:putative SOS response-associated peptidase YedK
VCTNFTPTQRAQWVKETLGVDLPSAYPEETFPGYLSPLVVKSRQSERVACGLARFGLIPAWAKYDKISRHTYNARSETVHEKPSFRDAWRHAQHCIIAADAIFEPDWRSGRAVPTRITRADGDPLGIAGLWACWRSPDGALVHSYTMLTIPAGDHALMRCFHRPEDEKRMVVILPEAAFGDWLDAPAHRSREFLLPFAADALAASA